MSYFSVLPPGKLTTKINIVLIKQKKDTMAMFNFAIATASLIFLNLAFENRDSRFERAIKISCHPNCQVSNSCGFFNKNK